MSKIKTFFKRPTQMWQRIFGFLPVISFGGAALILSIFTIAPNFYELHPCGGKTSIEAKRH